LESLSNFTFYTANGTLAGTVHNPSPPSSSTELGAAASAAAAAAPSAPERLKELRELIAENDRASVQLLNRRLELVAEIWREKDLSGLPRADAERERLLQQHLDETNDGPLSRRGLAAFHGVLLSLTKQELGR
jgi:chorismate mutase